MVDVMQSPPKTKLITGEALLAALLGEEMAYPLFEWLRGLSFIQQGAHGLFPHDLARDVLDADLRWRNPQAYQTLHRQVRLYYGEQLRQHGPQSALAADLIYQNRYIGSVDTFFVWETLNQVSMQPATQELRIMRIKKPQRICGRSQPPE